jgi:hypothetical protein
VGSRRNQSVWVIFQGGPAHDTRALYTVNVPPPVLHVYSSAATPGHHIPHEYHLTGERISDRQWRERQRAAGNIWRTCEGGGPVAQFVRTLPAEPIPPSVPVNVLGHSTAHYMPPRDQPTAGDGPQAR